MKIMISIAVYAIALAIGLFLTQPLEFRARRWPKIALSAPLVFIIVSAMSSELEERKGMGLIVSGTALAFLWRGNIAGLFSGSISNFFYGDISSETGLRPSYRFAKNHRRDGEWEQAIAATNHELEKDPKNFEGLMLLAGIYQDMNQLDNALTQFDIILNDPDASVSQKEVARAERAQCQKMNQYSKIIVAQENSRR